MKANTDPYIINISDLKKISDGLSRLYQTVQQVNSFLSRPEVRERIRLFFENLEQLPEDTKRFLRDLAYRGWFLTDEMTLNELAVFLNLNTSQNSADEGQIDEQMAGIVERYIHDIKNKLYERFPPRRPVLEAAFGAHKQGQYNLSIPVFLAQTDGIGAELLNGVSPFSRKIVAGGLFATTAEINTLSSQVDTLLIDPLGLPLGITANTTSSERLQHPHLYNRHEVLHGISVDYGNKKNSLKAISMLGHIATVVYDVVREYRASVGSAMES
jgi:hypothetical protein